MENVGINLLMKYGIDPVEIISNPEKGIKEAMKVALSVRSRIEGYASGKGSNFETVSKTIADDQMSNSWFKAKSVFEEMTSVMVESGILKDSKGVAHLAGFLTDLSKNQLPSIVDHNFSRQKNVEHGEIESKKQLQQDYSALREGIFAAATLVGYKVDKAQLPPYTGNMNDSVPVSAQEARFYRFKYQVELSPKHKITFQPGTDWWEVAHALELHPLANKWKIADFMEWIEKTFDFDFNSAENLNAPSGTEVCYGMNLHIVKI